MPIVLNKPLADEYDLRCSGEGISVSSLPPCSSSMRRVEEEWSISGEDTVCVPRARAVTTRDGKPLLEHLERNRRVKLTVFQ